LRAHKRMSFTVLVTGSNGFVGRAVCNALTERGYNVRAAVRGPIPALAPPGEMVAVGDLSGVTDWSSAVCGVDAIIHLAARVHVMKENERDPLSVFRRINLEATEGLARAAATHGVKRLVYVSSIKVNGDASSDVPFGSGDPPRPGDAYAVSKWEAEQSLWRIAAASGLQVTVVRPPLVYGPGVGGNFLRLLRLVQRRIPLPLALVNNRRSMVYRENLASALIACATDERAAGNTYLVSDGEDLSTRDLVTRLSRLMGVPARLWPVPLPLLTFAAAVARKLPEIDRLIGSLVVDSAGLRETLRWEPPCTVEYGLSDTVRSFIESARQDC
jgi:nucleoside-diphosphate-sugar epimerase